MMETEDNKGNNKKGLVLFWVLAAAVAAGGVGYWSSRNLPQPAKPAEAQQTAAPEAAKTEPAQTAQAKPEESKPAETQPAAEPTQQAAAEPEKIPAVTPDAAPATAEAKPVEAAPAATTEAPKPAEPAPVEQKAETPAPATAEPAQQQVAAATPQEPAQPEAKPAEAPAVEPPSFDTVRIEPTGDAVIAGRAAPGADVTVKLDGQVIGTAKADATGAFAYVSEKPLPPGAGALTLETTVGGKQVASADSVAVAVKEQAKGEAMVAVIKPDQPAAVVQAPATPGKELPKGSVALSSVDYDAAGNIVFAGRGEAGAKVRVYVDNAAAGEITVAENGAWSFQGGSSVSPGKHTLRADQLKADGSVASRVELPFLREEPEKVAVATAPEAASAAEPAQTAEATTAAAPEPARMIVQPGNSLWRLSRKVYGKGIRYTIIWEANKDQIRNPNRIYPGQVFTMPEQAN